MRRICEILLIGCLLALSCSRESLPEGEEAVATGPGIELSLRCSDAVSVKTTEAGVEAFGENRIKTVDCFFYPAGGTGEDAIVVYRHSETGVTQSQAVFSVPVNVAAMSVLFPLGVNSCEVFVVVNYPGTLDLTHTYVDYLKAQAVSASFKLSGVEFAVQESFVMTGSSTVALTSRTAQKIGSGTITATRLAAKLGFGIHVEEGVEIAATHFVNGAPVSVKEHWTPMTDQVKAYLVNASSTGLLSGEVPASPTLFQYNERSFYIGEPSTPKYPAETHDYTRQVSDGAGGYTTETVSGATFVFTDPFYTYPLSWLNNGDASEPYIKLVLPWRRKNEEARRMSDNSLVQDEDGHQVYISSTQKQYYYRVIIPNDRFEANHYYKLFLNVAILGSEYDKDDVTLNGCTYYIAPWQRPDSSGGVEVNKDADIRQSRYLSVERSSYSLYNQSSLDIPYISSHAIRVSATATQLRYQDSVLEEENLDTEEYSLSVNAGARTVHLEHSLNNSPSADMDMTPVTFVITLHHEDLADSNTTYDKTVTVTQYPAMYLTTELSNGYVFVNGMENPGEDGTESITVGSLGKLYNRSRVSTTATEAFRNPNLNTIHVSILSEDRMYIADPRGDAQNISCTDPSFSLTGYRPAAEVLEDAVAPVFIIASSYGVSGADLTSYEDARNRCAAYQESGYPAGRWRLPTWAEIRYCLALSTYGLIPSLFNGPYWTGNGNQIENGVMALADKAAARCVYDAWYWGEEAVEGYKTTWSGFQTN